MNASGHPTLLRMPQWLGRIEERVLDYPIDAYRIDQISRDWFSVIEVPTATRIYCGLGPVELLISPAPF